MRPRPLARMSCCSLALIAAGVCGAWPKGTPQPDEYVLPPASAAVREEAASARARLAGKIGKNAVFGHRGDSEEAPENTLPAFRAAARGGFGIEGDVYATKDGVAVMFHDRYLHGDKYEVDGWVTNLVWRGGLDRVDAGAWKGRRWQGTRFATLDEFLELATDSCTLLLDIKDSNPWARVKDAIVEALARHPNVNPSNLVLQTGGDYIRKRVPGYRDVRCARPRLGWKITDAPRDLLRDVEELDGTRIAVWNLRWDEELVTADVVARAHARGIRVSVWTVNDAASAWAAFGRGVDWVITDRPAALWREMHEAKGSRISFAGAEASNYLGRTRVDADEDEFAVVRTQDGGPEACTAWGVCSRRVAVPAQAARWTLDFEIRADREWYRVESSEHWMNAVTFYGTDGKQVGREPLEIEFSPRGFVPFRFDGRVPRGATAATVRFGVNSNPPVRPGESVRIRHVRFATYGPGESVPDRVYPDRAPPLVRSAFAAPSSDGRLSVRYDLEEQTAVDWSRVAVTNVATAAPVPYEHDAKSLTLRPAEPWPRGAVRLDICVADTLGHAGISHKVFMVGEDPKPRRFALRDDGVTLVEGRPFFPIGIYGIARQERNGFDMDTAIRELMAAGVNLGHSYAEWKSREFMESAERNGLFLWTNGKPAVLGDGWFLDMARKQSANMAWYIGDDTSLNTTPQQLIDRDEACRMLDGTRLTCHADGTGATRAKSNLQDFVNDADVFMPEIYPFDGHGDDQCVAEVCRDVDRCFSDYARFGRKGRARAIWPILQCFDGMSWKRYPTAEEMYATSFAAVIHGGQGITWFKYGGPKGEKSRYSGMFRTEADWIAMTNITRRLASLAPVLLERTPPQPAPPEIVSGPATDPLGQPAVTLLLKSYRGHAYVLAVNASPEPVRARFALKLNDGIGKVAWEHREVRLRNGTFEDGFAAFAVHVYRF